MAGPIDYFSPDELDDLRKMTSRGVGAATDTTATQSIGDAYKAKKAALSAQRAGISTPAPASAAEGVLAPTATAEAAASPTLGQRILGAKDILSKGVNYALRGIGGAQAAKGAYDAATGGLTSGAVDNVFNGAATAAAPGVGLLGSTLSSVRDAVLNHFITPNSVGPNSTGPELQKQIDAAGGLDNLLKQQQAKQQAPEELSSHQEAPLSDIPDGVPANGTGYIKNETTGKVTAIGTPTNRSSVTRYVQQSPTVTPSGPAPQGGVFSTLLGPLIDQARGAGLGAALDTRQYKRAQAQKVQDLEQSFKQGSLDVQNRTAGAHELQALAAVKSSMVKENPTKVVQDVLGNPIIVNPVNGTAVKPPVQSVPTMDEFVKKAREVNKNASDVQLQAYYKQKYGG